MCIRDSSPATRSIISVGGMCIGLSLSSVFAMLCIMLQSLAQLLCEMRDVNKSLQFEVDDLKQKLKDSYGDIKVSLFSLHKFLTLKSVLQFLKPNI